MAALPWITTRQPVAGPDALVLGSRLTLRSYRDTLAFLRAAMKLRRQVLDTPGGLGVSMIAEPGRKTYWTLSAWTDQAALDRFVGTSPHSDVMRHFGHRLTGSSFTTWTVPVAELPARPTDAKQLWKQARQRLESAASGIARPTTTAVGRGTTVREGDSGTGLG